MSAIIATAPVPAHLRLNEADTGPIPALPSHETDVEATALGHRVAALVADPAMPAEYRAAFAADVTDAETLLAYEKALKVRLAEEYLAGGQAVLDRVTPAITGQHPAWESDCFAGDTPMHVSREFTVTVPSGMVGKMVEIGAQVQQTGGEPADIWLTGGGVTVSVEDAEAFAAAILAAAALARRVNAGRAQ